ncbi:MAG: GIY-YIG nuclease family protein [Candidatus Shapirobacteria bacterium]|nr:GIY-YIG nuclease family protein [Candidatus Shapirobacteria bacterium]
MFYVYFLESLKNSKIYVGSTSKTPTVRLKEHNLGKNTWTRDNGPFKLIYYETYVCEEDAKLREKFYKMGFGKLIKKVIIQTLKQTGFSAIG